MILFLLIFLLAGLAQFFMPWWVITPVCFLLAAWRGGNGRRAFLAGFLGIGLGWLILAGWLNAQNDGLLAHRVAQLLPLGGNAWLLVLVAAIIGGLVGGLAALAGAWARSAFVPAASSARNSSANLK